MSQGKPAVSSIIHGSRFIHSGVAGHIPPHFKVQIVGLETYIYIYIYIYTHLNSTVLAVL
jgi:hypothetical protein